MARSPRTEVLEERVREFERALAGFESMRTRLLDRRQNATDSAMLRIDEMLKVNARTLKSLSGALECAKLELKRELGESSRNPVASPGTSAAFPKVSQM